MAQASQAMGYYYDNHHEINRLDKKSLERFNKIFELLDEIESNDMDRRILLWIAAPRGTVQGMGFANDDEILDYFEAETMEEAEQKFKDDYPDDRYWFRLFSAHNDICRFMRFGAMNIVIYHDEKKEKITGQAHNLISLLDWIYVRTKECIEQIRKGTYMEFMEENFPYSLRVGTISRKKYWELKPEDKKYEIGDLSEQEIQDFIKLSEDEGGDYMPSGRVHDLTFNKYFQIVVPCYKEMGLEMVDGSLKEQFERYAEDFGGRVLDYVDLDSVEVFNDYHNGKYRAGGHPFGVWRGNSRVRIMLYPQYEKDGIYFTMHCNPNWNCTAIVKMYLALRKFDVPVKMIEMEEVVSYLEENDLIGIVPEDEIIAYCQSYFPYENVNDFRHFEEEIRGMKEAIKWHELDELKLKG